MSLTATEILTLFNDGLLDIKTLTDEQKQGILETDYSVDDLTRNGKAYKAYMKVKDALKKEVPKPEAPQHEYPPEAIEMVKGWFATDDMIAALVESYPTEYESIKENRNKIKTALYAFLGMYEPHTIPVINQLVGEKGTGKSTTKDALVDMTFPFNLNRGLKGIVKPQSWIRASERLDYKRPVVLATDDLEFDDAAQENLKPLFSKSRNQMVMVTGANGRQEFIPICERPFVINTKVEAQGDEQILDRSLIYTFESNYYDENGVWVYRSDIPEIEETEIHKEACDYFWSNLPYPQRLKPNHRDPVNRMPINRRRFDLILAIARGIALSRHSETLDECHILEAAHIYIDDFMTIQEDADGVVAPELDRKLKPNEEKVYKYLYKRTEGIVSWKEMTEGTGLYKSELMRIIYGRQSIKGDKTTYSGGILPLISNIVIINNDYKSKDEYPLERIHTPAKRMVSKSRYDLVSFEGDEIEPCRVLDSTCQDLQDANSSDSEFSLTGDEIDQKYHLHDANQSDCKNKLNPDVLCEMSGLAPASDWEAGKVTPLKPSTVAHSFAELTTLKPEFANKESED